MFLRVVGVGAIIALSLFAAALIFLLMLLLDRLALGVGRGSVARDSLPLFRLVFLGGQLLLFAPVAPVVIATVPFLLSLLLLVRAVGQLLIRVLARLVLVA
eukprot:1799706-Pyramimonas_sp.AAC.1